MQPLGGTGAIGVERRVQNPVVESPFVDLEAVVRFEAAADVPVGRVVVDDGGEDAAGVAGGGPGGGGERSDRASGRTGM
jgi:hypothetical protein